MPNKIVNCQIENADIRFYPDFNISVMEIVYRCELGTGCLELKPDDRFMFTILDKQFLKDFVGSIFRIEFEDDVCVKIIHPINNYIAQQYKGNII